MDANSVVAVILCEHQNWVQKSRESRPNCIFWWGDSTYKDPFVLPSGYD